MTGRSSIGSAGHEAGLWKDAWRQLRRSPLFILSAITIGLFTLMAAFPRLYLWYYPGSTDPRDCSLSNSVGRPSADAWFGFDLQGCDVYANVIWGTRSSIAVAVLGAAGLLLVAFFTELLLGRRKDRKQVAAARA